MMIRCDFHNHSCLSPCGSLDMSPSFIARSYASKGVEIVGISDHNSALNSPAFHICARREGIAALYGVEATSSEEAHLLCLFSDPEEALDFGAYLEKFIPPIPYNAEQMGDQVVVDEDDNVIDLPELFFGSALFLSWDELCHDVQMRGGLVIPAHIDRPYFGVIAQLGFLPDGPYDAVETVRPLNAGEARNYPVICSSDAHYPEHTARRPFALELEPGWKLPDGRVRLDSIRNALAGGRIRLPFAG